MPKRGLVAADITILGAAEVEFYHLVKIDFAVPLYYTTAPHDIDYDGDTYLSNGTLKSIPNINESIKIKPQTTSLVLSGSDDALHVLMLTEDYKNAEVTIMRRLSNGTVVHSFLGFCDGYKATEDLDGGSSGDIILNVSNHWANWEAINGRKITHISQETLHTDDYGFLYAGVTNDVLRYWGTLPFWVGINPEGERYNYHTLVGYDATKRTNMRNVYDYESATANVKTVPVVYGPKKIIGTPVFRSLVGNSSEKLWVVYVLAEGECDSLVGVEVEGKAWNDASFNGGVMSPIFHEGTLTQAADATLMAASIDWWAAMKLTGVCYGIMMFDASKYNFGSEPEVIWDIKGKKLHDVRAPGSPDAYSSNNALATYDYMTSATYGKSLPASKIGTQSFIDAANYCDTTNYDHDEFLGGTRSLIKLFEIRGTIDNGQSVLKNTEALLFTMRAHLTWSSGLYEIVVERDDDVPMYTFDSDNTTGKVDLTEKGIKDLANEVHYEWIDPNIEEGSSTEIAISSTFLAEDNGRVLVKKYSNKFEGNKYRALNRAETLLKRSRQQIEIDIESSNADSFQIQAGNVVGVTRALKGWTNKPYRVSEMVIYPNGKNTFKLIEHENSVNDWDVSIEQEAPPDTTRLDPSNVVAPTGLTLAAGTSELTIGSDGTITPRILATWTKPLDEYFVGYNVYIQRPSDTSKLLYNYISDKDTLELYIAPVEEGITYIVSIAAVNALGHESSHAIDAILVLGKSADPTAPTGLAVDSTDENVVNLSWAGISDLDVGYYEVYAHTANDRSLASQVGATKGLTLSHPTSVKMYYWVRAFDTSENSSDWHPLSSTSGVPGTPDIVTSNLAGSGVNIVPAGYSQFDNPNIGITDMANGSYSILPTAGFEGTGGLVLSATALDYYVYLAPASTDYNIFIKPNKTWIVSGKVKITSAHTDKTIDVYAKTNESDSHKQMGSAVGDTVAGSSWQDFSGIIDLTDVDHDTSTMMMLRIDNDGGSGVVMVFDQIMIEEQVGTLETPSAYAPPVGANYEDYRVSNSVEADSMLTIRNPVGATYSSSSNVTGAIVIRLPQSWTATMMKMIADVYLYDTDMSFSLGIGGYNISSAWEQTFAQLWGNAASNNKVRFGHDGTYNVIVIGDVTDVWKQPKISVKDFQAGKSNYDFAQWDDNWDVTIVSSLSGYTFTSAAEISDALLDAYSVAGIGVIASGNVETNAISDMSTGTDTTSWTVSATRTEWVRTGLWYYDLIDDDYSFILDLEFHVEGLISSTLYTDLRFEVYVYIGAGFSVRGNFRIKEFKTGGAAASYVVNEIVTTTVELSLSKSTDAGALNEFAIRGYYVGAGQIILKVNKAVVMAKGFKK